MKVILIIIFIFLHQCIIGQIKIQNLSLTKPDTAIIYVGIDNKIKVDGLNDNHNTTLMFSGNNIVLDKNGYAVIRAAIVGKARMILKKEGKELFSKEYTIDLIPKAKTRFGLDEDTRMTFDNILRNNKLSLYLPNCYAKLDYDILSFKLTIYSKEKSITQEHDIEGDKIPLHIIKFISQLQSGDKLHFKPLRVIGPEDEHYESVEITIK